MVRPQTNAVTETTKKIPWDLRRKTAQQRVEGSVFLTENISAYLNVPAPH
jgi:hypothetical protein